MKNNVITILKVEIVCTIMRPLLPLSLPQRWLNCQIWMLNEWMHVWLISNVLSQADEMIWSSFPCPQINQRKVNWWHWCANPVCRQSISKSFLNFCTILEFAIFLRRGRQRRRQRLMCCWGKNLQFRSEWTFIYSQNEHK